MHHAFHKIVNLRLVRDHTLRLVFDNGCEREINFAPLCVGEIFGPLAEPGYFAQVRLDPEWGTISWPNGADLDPDLLYQWDELGSAFVTQCRQHLTAQTV